MYDAIIGRFFSEDPIRMDSGDLNYYRYCENDPINRVDPSGLTIEFKSKDNAEQFAKLLRDKFGARNIKVVEDTVAGETCYHVYTTLQDTEAVFKYVDQYFAGSYDDPKPGRPYFLPGGQNKEAIEEAKRRTRFLEALMTNPAFQFSDKDGNSELPCKALTLKLQGGVQKDVKAGIERVTIKIDHGGEGRGNKDRINFNICGRGTMQPTTAGKLIPRLIPKTEPMQPTPFIASSVDEVWFVSFSAPDEVFDAGVLDAGRILKLKGKIIIEGPDEAPYRQAKVRSDEAVKVLTDKGYKVTSSYGSITDPDHPDTPSGRGIIVIDEKPTK